jgi:hypothetical protein
VAGGGSGERQRRCCGSAQAGARFPARLEVRKFNKWPWELPGGLGKRVAALTGGGSERRGKLTEAAAMADPWRRCSRTREERGRPFIADVRAGTSLRG